MQVEYVDEQQESSQAKIASRASHEDQPVITMVHLSYELL